MISSPIKSINTINLYDAINNKIVKVVVNQLKLKNELHLNVASHRVNRGSIFVRGDQSKTPLVNPRLTNAYRTSALLA